MNYLVVGAGRMTAGVIFDLLNNTKTKNVHVTDLSEKVLSEIKNQFSDPRLKTHRIIDDDRDIYFDHIS